MGTASKLSNFFQVIWSTWVSTESQKSSLNKFLAAILNLEEIQSHNSYCY